MNPLREHRTHGRTGTPTYRAWIGMRQRCHNPNAANYPDYGGRGIRVCERWLKSFENFLADMGEKPSSRHSIGRVNNDGDYTPENCCWQSVEEQLANRRPYRNHGGRPAKVENPVTGARLVTQRSLVTINIPAPLILVISELIEAYRQLYGDKEPPVDDDADLMALDAVLNRTSYHVHK